MFAQWIRRIAAVTVVPLAFVACDDNGFSSGTTEMSLLLTDAPGNVAEAWVEIEEIYLQGESDDGGRVFLLEESTGLIELTQLAGTTLSLVENEPIPAGTYGQLRIVIGGAVLVSEDGGVFSKDGAAHPDGLATTGTLNCPSCSQTGIKIVLPEGAQTLEGEGVILVLDFDVSQSFGQNAGQSGMWVMHPVVHATEFAVSGGISGTVDVGDVVIPECPAGTARDVTDFRPTATAQTLLDGEDNPVVRTGIVETDGTFSIGFVEPDGYDMGFVAEIDLDTDRLVFDASVDPATVSVGSGQQVSGVAYTLTSASCEAVEQQ